MWLLYTNNLLKIKFVFLLEYSIGLKKHEKITIHLETKLKKYKIAQCLRTRLRLGYNMCEMKL